MQTCWLKLEASRRKFTAPRRSLPAHKVDWDVLPIARLVSPPTLLRGRTHLSWTNTLLEACSSSSSGCVERRSATRLATMHQTGWVRAVAESAMSRIVAFRSC